MKNHETTKNKRIQFYIEIPNTNIYMLIDWFQYLKII